MKIDKIKLKEWLNRYGLAEFFWLIWTVVFSCLSYTKTWNLLFSAYMWAIGENIWYYGVILFKESFDSSYTWNFFARSRKKLRNILFEFWFPELLDFFFVRPFFLYFMPILLGNYIIWIIIWKFLAEWVFYWGTIFLYELRKKIFKN